MTTRPLILSIETATLGGSVCLSEGDRVLATSAGNPELSHSNTLLSDISICLNRAGVSVNDVQLFAAASGPGSFTGLRIGIATIKGLAATLGRPCVGIPTLHAIAHAAGPSEATVALLPAGRGEVFVQLLAVSDEGVTELEPAAHLLPERAIERYGSRPVVKWTGPGAGAHRALIQASAEAGGHRLIEDASAEAEGDNSQGWLLITEEGPLANHVAALASQRFQRGNVEEAEALTAIYVRPSDAELKCK